MSIKDNIMTLGIPRRHKCPVCGKTESLNISERKNIADCMISNCKGYLCIDSACFPFIKWEDKRPWSIEELLKLEVEDESI